MDGVFEGVREALFILLGGRFPPHAYMEGNQAE